MWNCASIFIYPGEPHVAAAIWPYVFLLQYY